METVLSKVIETTGIRTLAGWPPWMSERYVSETPASDVTIKVRGLETKCGFRAQVRF